MGKWLQVGFNEPRACTKCLEVKDADEFHVRVAGKRRRRECKLCFLGAMKERYPEGRGAPQEAKGRWIRRNAIKRACHVIVGNAIRDGKLIKKPCEVCGAEEVHAHHDDYSQPLRVRWLCPKHHKLHHQIEAIMQKTRAQKLEPAIEQCRRNFSEKDRTGNPTGETFQYVKKVIINDDLVAVLYRKQPTEKFALARFEWRNTRGGIWEYCFPSYGQISGVMEFAELLAKVEEANYPKNFVDDDGENAA